jgi:hypothetical protein
LSSLNNDWSALMKPRREFGTPIGLATEILRREDAEMRRCEESELRCDRLARQPVFQFPSKKSQRPQR